jgi:hypothetical protein
MNPIIGHFLALSKLLRAREMKVMSNFVEEHIREYQIAQRRNSHGLRRLGHDVVNE